LNSNQKTVTQLIRVVISVHEYFYSDCSQLLNRAQFQFLFQFQFSFSAPVAHLFVSTFKLSKSQHQLQLQRHHSKTPARKPTQIYPKSEQRTTGAGVRGGVPQRRGGQGSE